MQCCEIYIANKDKTKVLKLPVIPEEMPEQSCAINNEEFETYNNGVFNFIKKQGLKTMSLDSWLPMKDYYFLKSSVKATEIIKLINDAINNTECIQVVMLGAYGETYVNDKFSVEGFTYHILRNGNYSYNLSLKQYRETTKKVYALGWNKDATGWWYCYDYENYKWYNDGWHKVQGDTEWYYFNANGYALSNQWLLYKNKWYWLRDNCQMKHSGWEQIKGIWYYFYKDGSLAVNCTTPDGYKVDSNGAWIKG